MSDHDEHAKEFDSLLGKVGKILVDSVKGLNSPPYNGVVGLPPRWIPEWSMSDFIRFRSRLLDIRGYSTGELLNEVNRYYDVHMTADGDLTKYKPPAKYPNGSPVDEYGFKDEVGYLAWLRWCVSLGKKDGGKVLGRGFSAADVGDKGRDSKNKKIEASKDYVFKNTQSEWNKQEKEGKTISTVPVIGKKMLKALKGESEIEEYKDIYFIPKKSMMPRWINQAIKEGVLIRPGKAK